MHLYAGPGCSVWVSAGNARSTSEQHKFSLGTIEDRFFTQTVKLSDGTSFCLAGSQRWMLLLRAYFFSWEVSPLSQVYILEIKKTETIKLCTLHNTDHFEKTYLEGFDEI